jgi:hypothetical protein
LPGLPQGEKLMFLFWRIRYLDSRDKQFKNRDLWLETDSLDPASKAAVETIHDLGETGQNRKMLRYRHLFQEKCYAREEWMTLVTRHGGMNSVFIVEYFEDENGKELTDKRMAEILTGNPNAVMFPVGTPPHVINYALSPRRPIPMESISLSAEQLNVLGYFTRDLREVTASTFYKNGPGTLTTGRGRRELFLQTATSDEEIRSFVTIFRRLYIENEPASFRKAVAAFTEATQGYALSDYVTGVLGEYDAVLGGKPHFAPFVRIENCSFTQKRLIDVFLYTRYSHQPDEKRARQFQECLASVGGNLPGLTWLFLSAMWYCAIHIRNAGVMVAQLYDRYCQVHNASCSILPSVLSDNPQIGTLETKEARQERVLREKATELARQLWSSAGSPSGGPDQFFPQAQEQLRKLLE